MQAWIAPWVGVWVGVLADFEKIILIHGGVDQGVGPSPMPAPQKGYKTINHHDTQYRWIMQNRRGVSELVVEASAPVNGQVLIAELPRIVSYDMVTEAIDFAHANGWRPNESGAPLRCKHFRNGFRMTTGG